MGKSKANATQQPNGVDTEVDARKVRKLLLSEMEMNRRRQNIVENVWLN